MNPQSPREELEIRITALLMGELPPDEIAALQEQIAADAELSALHARLQRAMGLLREASAIPEQPAPPVPARISDERRARLLAHFKGETKPGSVIVKPRRDWKWAVPLGLAASLMALIGGAMYVNGFAFRKDSAKFAFAFEGSGVESGSPELNEPGRVGAIYLPGSMGEPDGSTASAPSAPTSAGENAVANSIAANSELAQQAQGLSEKTIREVSDSLRGLALEGMGKGAFGLRGSGRAVAALAVRVQPSPGVTAPPAKAEMLRRIESEAVDLPKSQTTAGRGSAMGEGGEKPLSVDPNLTSDIGDGLPKTGGGTIVLSGAGTYTGAATITGGVLQTEGKMTSAAPPVPEGKPYYFKGPAEAAPEVHFLGDKRETDGRVARRDGASEVENLADMERARSGHAAPAPANPEERAKTANGDFAFSALNAPAPADPARLEVLPSPIAGTSLDLARDKKGAKLAQAGDELQRHPGGPSATLGLGKVPDGKDDQKKRDVADGGKADGLDARNAILSDLSEQSVGKHRESVAQSQRQKAIEILTDMFRIDKDISAAAEAKEEKGAERDKDVALQAGEPKQPAAAVNLKEMKQVERLGKKVNEAILEKSEVRELKKEVQQLKEPGPPAPKLAPNPLVPQPEIQTSGNAFSTFSLNVSDVAFKLAAASLERGVMPDVSTLRTEEFINAFDYRDPEPAPGAPLAFASERARYPFAQNRDVIRLSVKTAAAGRQPGKPLNVVLLLDNSGSMERADRVRIVREGLRTLSAQLTPQDKLSIVAFSRTPRLWADGVAGNKAGELTARVGEITPEGGTNLGAALDLGYKTALRHYQPGSINHVVLLTDGAANLGDVDPAALKQKVETHRKQGIALDCFGVGWEGLNDDMLEQLSRNGDGRYGFINTPEEAATNFAAQLAGALRVAASDVKVQVEWNPKRVTAYRQVGYAKHQLTKEQFRDNTVDAAELAAAESGNALYVIEVNPRGEGDLATVRVRFKVPGTSDYREHEWAVPFAHAAGPLENSSSSLRLAATAAAFSEMLAGSPFAMEVTSDRLLGLLSGVPAIHGADARPKKLKWMIRQAKSLSGR
jgi:autotransporter-associated beta strand protein